MIKSIGVDYRIYDLIIVKIAKKNSRVLDYELLNATFEPLNHAFALSRFFLMHLFA
jgi:hypothetical protein